MKIVIIGGVAGGASAAARLRRLDEKAEIILLERGEFISFANCGLPYYIGGEIADRRALTLQTPESFHARFRVDVRVRQEAVRIDPEQKTVLVRNLATEEEYLESYDKLILSPGAEPVRPPVEGLSLPGVFTLRNIPDTLRIKAWLEEKRPRSAVVVGGGYIGVEMAENLRRAGLEVTIVELADHLVAPLDFDMAAELHGYLRQNGVSLRLRSGVQGITERSGRLAVRLERGEIETDLVLLAVGVRPETALAAGCGIERNRRGSILVDDRMCTSIPDIYAVGDAVAVRQFVTGEESFLPLAGPANRQGRIAADNICGGDSRYAGTQGSAILKAFDMAVAATGLNETAAKAAGIDYDKTYLYAPSHASYYPGGSGLSLKILWEKKSGRLLGAQLLGFEGVDKRMDVLATALRLGAKVTDLVSLELCYAPPFGSAKDPVNLAGFIAENVRTGKLRQFFWEEVEHLPRDGSVTLLDVRTAAEVARGRIEGTVHIPLDSLRERLGELPKDRPVYVHCHSGLRSYVACRILTGHGYDCYNLAGGYRLYASAVEERSIPDYRCADCG